MVDQKISKLDIFSVINAKVQNSCMIIKNHIKTSKEFSIGLEKYMGNYLLYIIDDILRASMSLIENIDQIKDETPLENTGDDLHRLVLEYIFFQQKYWYRKLLESLLELIVFSKNNNQYNFKLYHLLKRLEDNISKKQELKDFYDCSNNNLDYQIQKTIEAINTISSDNSITSFVFSYIKFPILKTPTIRDIKTSVNRLFKEAILIADTREKLLIGDSYNSIYGDTSQFMHLGQEGIMDINYEFIRKEIGSISLTSINILIRIKNLLGLNMENLDNLELLLDSDKSEAGNLFNSLTDKQYDIGDIVFVSSNLVEITNIKKSSYGYASFEIKYLGNPPIHSIKQDRFPSKFFGKRVLSRINPCSIPDGMEIFLYTINYKQIVGNSTFDDNQKYEALKNLFIDLENKS